MKKMLKQINCYHENAVGIFGDAIENFGGKRGYCPDCGAYLNELPPDLRTWEDEGGYYIHTEDS